MIRTVLFLGAYDTEYPRNHVIRVGLSSLGVETTELRSDVNRRTISCYSNLLSRLRRLGKQPFDAVIVPEFNQRFAPLGYAASRWLRVPLLCDPFVSAYHSFVFERKLFKPGGPRAALYWMFDKWTTALADCLLADTACHKEYLSKEFKVRPDKIHVVPVGADESIFHPGVEPEEEVGEVKRDIEVLFWGSFVPLHGVEYILGAARRLREQREIGFTLVGGHTKREMERWADKWRLENVRFYPSVPLLRLPGMMARADFCLGIFGGTQQAQRVVPNKVYSALAMGKATITGDSPAAREWLTHGENAYLVPMRDEAALADAVLALARSGELRKKLESGAMKTFYSALTTRHIGAMVKAILEGKPVGDHRPTTAPVPPSGL